jgi:MFS family permease
MNIEEEVRGARLSWFHYRLALVLGAVLFIDGYDLFNAAYVAPYIRQEWGLSDGQIGLMLSMGVAGLALGAFVQAPVTRAVGRRLAVTIGVLLLAATSVAMATVVHDYMSFVAMRLVLGISLGMLSPLAFVYVNEWAPQSTANRFATIAFVLPFSLGGIAAGIAGIVVGPDYGWRGLYMLAALGFPCAVLAFLWLPESLVRLVERGRMDQIRAYLTAIRPERAGDYLACTAFHLPAPSAGRVGVSALFSPRYRRTTIGIWIASALSLLGLHGVSGWLPSILVGSGQAFGSAFAYGTLLMTMQILGGGVTSVLADRFGRTPVMVVGFICGGFAMLALQWTIGGTAIALAVAAAGLCIFGTQAVMNNFTAQAYEPSLRALGTGLAVAFSRIGGVLGPLLIGFTRSLDDTLLLTFGLLASAQLLAALIVLGLLRPSVAAPAGSQDVAAT